MWELVCGRFHAGRSRAVGDRVLPFPKERGGLPFRPSSSTGGIRVGRTMDDVAAPGLVRHNRRHPLELHVRMEFDPLRGEQGDVGHSRAAVRVGHSAGWRSRRPSGGKPAWGDRRPRQHRPSSNNLHSSPHSGNIPRPANNIKNSKMRSLLPSTRYGKPDWYQKSSFSSILISLPSPHKTSSENVTPAFSRH